VTIGQILWNDPSGPPGGTITTFLVANSRYGTVDQQPGDTPFHQYTITEWKPADVTLQLLEFFIHGGGGSIPTAAQNQFIKKDAWSIPATVAKTNWAMLKGGGGIIVWICSGGIPDGTVGPWNPNGADTRALINAYGTAGVELFSNGMRRNSATPIPSGQKGGSADGFDTPQFCKDAMKLARSMYPGVIIAQSGHSEGGIMVGDNHMSHAGDGTGADVYHVIAGPMTTTHEGDTFPAIVKPHRGVWGMGDINIGITDGVTGISHLSDYFWPQLVARSDAYAKINNCYPSLQQQFLGDLQFMQLRVNAYNTYKGRGAETVNWADAVISGNAPNRAFTLSYGGGAIQATYLEGCPHDLPSIQRAMFNAKLTTASLVLDCAIFAFAHHSG
jgi:hypothetical protein